MRTTKRTTTTTKESYQVEDAIVCVSKYIQAMIIDMLINDSNDKDHYSHHGFHVISPENASYLMLNKTPKKKETKFVSFYELADIAMVSKWWMEVASQITSKSIEIDGPLRGSYFSKRIESFKWNVYSGKGKEVDRRINYDNFDYTRLPRLLPHLKTLDIVGVNLDKKAVRAIVQVINLFPHIQATFDLSEDHNRRGEWPSGVKFTGIKPVVSIKSVDHYGYFDDPPVIETFHRMIYRLQPTTIHIGSEIGSRIGEIDHYNYQRLFPFLKTCTQHINIEYDFIELRYLKDIVNTDSFNHTQSLNTGIVVMCPLEEELNGVVKIGTCSKCTYGLFFVQDTLKDWDQLCTNLTNNTSLKQLCLGDRHGPRRPSSKNRFDDRWYLKKILDYEEIEMELEEEETIQTPSVSVERLVSSFSPIWQTNNTIELLGLSNLARIISPLFFDSLSLNHSITILKLTNGTLEKEYIPSFCQLIMTNQTIKALDISGNRLAPSTDLNQAFQQNKSIQILNIANNQFKKDIFDSLLESDSVQYLMIDYYLSDYKQHRYFIESKSLINCFNAKSVDTVFTPYYSPFFD
ncbi:hypothetical protein DFA_06489 [Cavenderia fasciculata]|uniref:Leucine-rich repeat-containing protein n=1 Tax=Cavenderia fasciculata TaxID=261658 RepID=F4PJ53_CACFS|nr:uncharacterized protein DFA_06489 [Cavenderia fasciculata]EGG24339.1 hypothetical protein DFA_06489 [Cavenderia fasciculata]|eukprot:XP_004362190.1 hypothetical protein DFA_06489 [Cavenderia fasciculata]